MPDLDETASEGPRAESGETAAKPKPRRGDAACPCIADLQDRLKKEHGLRFRRGCVDLIVAEDLDLVARYGFPLETVEGKKPGRRQARILFFSHCPFCGGKLPGITSRQTKSAKALTPTGEEVAHV